VDTRYGTAVRFAPAIFRVAEQSRRGLVANQDGKLASVSVPAKRGEAIVIYATGLGITSTSGMAGPAQTPVVAVLGGQVSYAGLTPGFAGLYQVNIVILVTFTPGLGKLLTLRQGGAESAPVEISIQ